MTEETPTDKVYFPPHCRTLREQAEVEEGGWREALVSAGDHLARVLSEYGELGFECLLEELDVEAAEGCTGCFKSEGEPLYRLYVRPAEGPDREA
ncbi:MAG: hypothetical protein AB1384_09460 [Actinomycetota bacterium]